MARPTTFFLRLIAVAAAGWLAYDQALACGDLEQGFTEASETHIVFENTAADVFYHQLAKEFDLNPYRLGGATSTVGYGFRGYTQLNYLYARDYFPMQVKVQRNGEPTSVFVIYPSLIHNGNAFHINSPKHSAADQARGTKTVEFETSARKLQFQVNSKTLPLLFEGGNLLSTQNHVLVGEKTFTLNGSESELLKQLSSGQDALLPQARELLNNAKASGWRERSREEVIEELSAAFEIEGERFVFLEGMPYERTEHIDMYIGTLKPGVVAVPYIPKEVIGQLTAEKETTASNTVNTWFEGRVKQLESLGIEVMRLPMLPPSNLQPSADALGLKGNILSPVNWVVGERSVQVPYFPKAQQNIPSALAEKMNAEITEKLAKAGFATTFIEADKLAATNGLLHCISAQYDFSEFR